VELIKGKAPLWPRLETDDYWMVVGSSRPMEDSWRIAQLEMIRWFGELFELHEMDAYQLLSQITEAPSSQCCRSQLQRRDQGSQIALLHRSCVRWPA